MSKKNIKTPNRQKPITIVKKPNVVHVKPSDIKKVPVNSGDKNAQVLAATVGGAVLGNLIVPGIGGAFFGGLIGALLGKDGK